MQYTAHHRFADMSARKIRPFAALIRGRNADEALELLRFLPNKSARLLEQVLKSALGNAEDRGARDIDDLVVVESRVDGGPMMKRIMPRARGSASRILKRTSHIRIVLSDEIQIETRETRKAKREQEKKAAKKQMKSEAAESARAASERTAAKAGQTAKARK